MLRSILFVTALAALGSLPMPALAKKSVLTTADQNRIVCLPLRDKAGALAGGEICKTGREWEIVLARARPKHTEWYPSGSQYAYLAGPGYFRLR